MRYGGPPYRVSLCTEKQEVVSAQYDLLPDERERHRDRVMYRRNRRGRLRHRKRRFDNRRKLEGWLAPTLRNKLDQHVQLYQRYAKYFPITDIYIEMGGFDLQVLAAVEAEIPILQGMDYQHGPRYGYDTLREAVFTRDKYTCHVCGKGIKDRAVLRMHHLGFRIQDRSNRMDNLLTVCTKCHTAKSHKKGGKLWKLGFLVSAAHMNGFRWALWETLQEVAGPDAQMQMTYGAATKGGKTRNMPCEEPCERCVRNGKTASEEAFPHRIFQKATAQQPTAFLRSSTMHNTSISGTAKRKTAHNFHTAERTAASHAAAKRMSGYTVPAAQPRY